MDKNFGHIMVDIETLGNESGSVIASIGAVEFNIANGDTGKEFNVNVDIQSCLDLGLKVNGETILWWMRQDENARKSLMSNTTHISNALQEFSKFIAACDQDSEIWGNSNRFDLGILNDAYSKNFMSIPWKFWKERDVRTLVSFYPEIKDLTKFNGTAHSAVDDCHHQIKYCSEIWRKIKGID